jgi:hypothetical protein
VDGVVAGLADDKGLAPALCHEFHPCWLWPSRPGEAGELADLVNIHLAALPADLASLCEEPGDQLLAADDDRGWITVVQDCDLLPP